MTNTYNHIYCQKKNKNIIAELLFYIIQIWYTCNCNKSIKLSNLVHRGMLTQSKVPEAVANLISTLSNYNTYKYQSHWYLLPATDQQIQWTKTFIKTVLLQLSTEWRSLIWAKEFAHFLGISTFYISQTLALAKGIFWSGWGSHRKLIYNYT